MTINRTQTYYALTMVIVFSLLAITWWSPKGASFQYSAPSGPPDSAPLYHEQFISFVEGNNIAAHASSATLRHDGKILAVWYTGSEEGAKDVSISSTVIDPETYTLSPSLAVATRLQTEKDAWRYIRKLGNPLVYQMDNGKIMLLYVSVSFGGWAASNLNVRFSDNGGLSWSPAQRIVTSPFINLSTLVRGAPVAFSNGDIGIPVYHEFIGKFGELLIIDADGRVKNKHRMSWGREAIQPAVVPTSSNNALALLRDSGEQHKRIAMTSTTNSGQDWAPLSHLPLANPNSAVAAMLSHQGSILLVFNNDEEERNNLSLAVSSDQGNSWKVIHEFENQPLEPGKKIKFSYPYLIKGRNNDYHLFLYLAQKPHKVCSL